MPRAKIAHKQAVYTLNQLHAELAGKLLANVEERQRLEQGMRHVEAVIKLLEPAYNLRPIAIRRRKPNPWFKRGTVFRLALDVLRAAEGPLTAKEIARTMLATKGVTDASTKAVRDLAGSVNASLQNHNGGTVRRQGDGLPARWFVCGNV